MTLRAQARHEPMVNAMVESGCFKVMLRAANAVAGRAPYSYIVEPARLWTLALRAQTNTCDPISGQIQIQIYIETSPRTRVQ